MIIAFKRNNTHFYYACVQIHAVHTIIYTMHCLRITIGQFHTMNSMHSEMLYSGISPPTHTENTQCELAPALLLNIIIYTKYTMYIVHLN